MTDGAWLTADVIDAVVGHMNSDHVEDNVVICRGVGGVDNVTAATCSSLDLHGVTFDAETPEGPRQITVPFAQPLVDRPQIRAEIAEMYHASAEKLGLPSRR